MKHAALIIAHKNVEQLKRLIERVSNNNVDVFVHIDKKWNISNEEINKVKSISDNVFVLDKRISGFLDTWSLCQIAVELMKAAYKNNTEYKYYMLLSGQDYPIKSSAYICNYLDSVYPKPIIDCTPMTKTNWIYSGFKWIRFRWYYRLVERITNNRKLIKLMLLPAYAIQAIVTLILGSPYKHLKKLNVDLYGGSAWWILPDEIVKLCIDEVESNSGLVKAFRIKNTPEETFFQTMAMRSNLKNMIELNAPDEVLQNCMTYAYFFDDEHEPTGHPFILTESNFDMLQNRKELFARKFDLNVDVNILDMIDLQILEKENRKEK